MIALALVGLPVALASYRERGVLRRLEAFGVSRGAVLGAQAVVTCGLVVLGAIGCWPSSRSTCWAAAARREAS